MIKSLAIVSLLSCGVGSQATPHFNNEQINQTKHVEQRRLYENNTSGSQQDADLTWQISNTNLEYVNRVIWDDPNWNGNSMHTHNVNYKYEKYNLTNDASMKTIAYTNQQFHRETDYNGTTYITGWNIPLKSIYNRTQSGFVDHTNTQLYQIEFSPYKTIKTSTIDLSFQIDVAMLMYFGDLIQTPLVAQTITTGIQYEITYIISTQTNWAQYMDRTLTQNRKSNYDLVQQMTSAQNGFTYQKIEKKEYIYTGEITYNSQNQNGTTEYTSHGRQTKLITQQIPIASDRTTYISIYLEPKTFLAQENYNDQTQQNYYEILTEQQLNDWNITFSWPTEEEDAGSPYIAFIKDMYHNVESTPQDLNTELVEWQWNLIHTSNITAYGTWIPTNTIEVIDLPGVMFSVLGMPWTFVSTAFNLTLFPGTPYSINVGSILAMVLGVLIFVFLIKLIIFKIK